MKPNSSNDMSNVSVVGFFIAKDGTLSATIQNVEAEVVGFHQSIFGGGWIVKDK